MELQTALPQDVSDPKNLYLNSDVSEGKVNQSGTIN